MNTRTLRVFLTLIVPALAACGPKTKTETRTPEKPSALVTVGSISIDQQDLDHHLQEKHGGRSDEQTRRIALEELTLRAQQNQAALDADLDKDPAVRAEMARVLATQYREKLLAPQLRELASQPITEARLRELYQENEPRFRSNEKRQIAVLWLNPNNDAERTAQYLEKLNYARTWATTADLKDQPGQGFSVLSVDHSEHQASRYKGGIVGWLESTGSMDQWTKAVAEIAFSLTEPGEVSQVISRPEGMFLVRYMDRKPAILRPLESVTRELEQSEKQRLRQELEAGFRRTLDEKYPSQRTNPPQP
ncbi:MAG: PPIC-type PPIASE domain-containing protein [Verrucomicrobia bacterium]|nr:MAG: PPIC-type PPIASE domain-containing protein [Verrucomicrobiota bacterium]